MSRHASILAAIGAAAVIVAVPIRASADDLIQNGNFWLTQTAASHIDYILGFTEGMQLGRNFAAWKWNPSSKDGATKMAAASNSFDTESQKYLTDVTVGQIVDGLNQFYSDFRNRNIMVHDAVWLVLQEIAGTPDSQLNLEVWRKTSRQ